MRIDVHAYYSWFKFYILIFPDEYITATYLFFPTGNPNQWSVSNFSLQYQYHIMQKGNENKEEHQQGDYIDLTLNSQNCI